eukprot:4748993-Pleurochrysis_carterae.AAC.1
MSLGTTAISSLRSRLASRQERARWSWTTTASTRRARARQTRGLSPSTSTRRARSSCVLRRAQRASELVVLLLNRNPSSNPIA